MSQSPVRDEDLLESIDPTWIKIQQNTFTRWVNQHLAQAKTSINDLQNDLGEDHTFIQLVQVLSHKSVGSYSRRVVFRSQKLENISLALKFLEEKEHIRLVNIDSAAIVDKNLKLILGLIWTLILHYSISSQIYDDVAVQEEKGTTQAPKQKLMQWIKAKLPAGLPFNNFTSDWNDGVLLGALVESCVPGSDLGWRDWVPDDALSSTRKAMFVAEEKLNIAPLITPEELINPMVDEKSVMTYLAQYPAAKYTPPVGSLRVDHAPYLKMPSSFMIETSSNLIRPTSISVLAPDEHEVSAVVKPISERAYTATYTPIVVGPHKIVVLLKDEGSGSVTKLVDDKVQVRQSPQLKYVPEGRVRKPMVFSMNTRDTTFPEAKIIDSEGRGEVIKFQSDGDQIRAAFTPTKSGVHRLIITHGGSHIPGSPFEINVKSSESYIVWGRGIVSDGVRVGDTVQFNLQGKTRPKQPFEVLVRDPEGSPVHCKEIESRYGDCSTFEYTPVKEGFYEVRVMYDGDHVENSPYKVRVSRKTDCPVRVFGSGLEGGIEKQASVFFLNACGVTDNLAFAIHGPSEAAISCVDNRDGTSLVSYIPKVAGIYRVNISLRNEEIRGSPFIVRVLSKEECLHLDEIRVVGFDRAEDEPLFPNQKARFMIDTTAANGVWPTVRLIDPQFEMSPLKMTRKSSGVFEGGFMPSDPGRYYFDVMAMNASLPNSPFQMNVRHPPTDAEALKMYGPGTEQTPVAGVQTEFYVDTAALGSGKLDVDLIDSAGNHHETEVIREGTTIYKVRYVLPKPGTYQLIVTFAGFVLRDVTFNVVPKVKKEDFVVKGTEKEKVLLGHVVDLNISAGHSVPSLSGLEVFVHEADGSKHKVEMRKDADDIYKGSWSMRSYGITKFLVYFDGVLVKESVMTVEKGLDVSKCVARGDGLKFATVNEPAKFQVTTQGAGDGRMALTIKGPSESHTSVKDLYDGSYLVEYVTTTPGLYEISVFFGEKKEPIPGSPFVVRADYAKDVDRITIDRPEKIRLNSLASLKVDASRTGVGELTAKLPSYCSQPIVKEVRPRIYEVTFTPSGTPGSILPLELMYDGQLIGKRPLSLIVDPETEPELVTVGGQNGILPKNLSASFPCTLFVDTSKAGKVTRISAEVNGPDGSPRNVTVTPTDNEHILKVQFDTDIEGVYKVWVFCNGLPTSAKPYEIKTVSSGHAEKCKIEGMSEEKFWQSGVPRQFVISKGNAGDGRLSIVPHSTLAFIAKQNEEPNGDILVQITPKEIGLYDLSLYYGGREIPGGRIRFESVLKREVSPLFLNKSPEIEYIPIEEVTEQSIRPYSFKFGFDRGWQLSDLKAVVATPSGQMNAATVQDNRDGTVTIVYQPREVGCHQLMVQHNGVNLVGSPMSFYVEKTSEGNVTVYGPGLSRAVVNEPALFTVSARGVAAKELSVAVEGCAKATIKCNDNRDGTCSVAWIPPMPGQYKIHVKLAGEPVANSPFTVLVAGEGQKRAHLSIGSQSEVSLNTSSTELKGLSASIKSPAGIEEPCFVRLIDPRHIGVSFTPREVGDHWITVKKNGQILPKAPYCITVDESQVGDASKVKVEGSAKAQAKCLEFNEFTVDTRGAGYGGLSVSVEGPSKAELRTIDSTDGLIHLAYRPTEPGVYVLTVKFADMNVKDSPFTINCTGEGIGAVKEVAERKADQPPLVFPGTDAVLYLLLPNVSPMNVSSKVMTPSGRHEDAEMRDLGDSLYQVKFRAEAEGLYNVSVFHKEAHVHGSPFPFTVGHITEGGAHKARAGGVGLSRGETNAVQSFNVYTREAGNGKLTVTVEGPSKAAIEFKDHKDGNCHVNYKVSAPGVYHVAVMFNGDHIPDSPFQVFIAPAVGEARRLELASFPDSGMPGKPLTFTVLTHRAAGHLEARVQTPSNRTESVDVVPIEDGEAYALRFMPSEVGNYYVDITLDGAPMRDSPFRIRVGHAEENDPTAITVVGDGIHGGQTGQKCEFLVNTMNAGSGLLQVIIDGPSKVTLDAYEVDEGYKVRYTPLVPGTYYASVKYSGIHVPGSPFKIVVDGEPCISSYEADSSMIRIETLAKTSKGTVAEVPRYTGDASKVSVKGTGLTKFFPGRPALFYIDTGLAGRNLLFVGVVTAKGPCEELNVKDQGNGLFAVTYRIQERARGFIFVKYGDDDIPGSPFAITS